MYTQTNTHTDTQLERQTATQAPRHTDRHEDSILAVNKPQIELLLQIQPERKIILLD